MAQQAVDVILEGGGSLEAAAEVVSVVTELDHFESARSGAALAFSGRIGVNVTYRDDDGEVQSELVLIPFEGRTPEFDPEFTAEVVEIREVHEFDAATHYFRQRVLVRVGAGEPIVPVTPAQRQPAPVSSDPPGAEADRQEVAAEPPEDEVEGDEIEEEGRDRHIEDEDRGRDSDGHGYVGEADGPAVPDDTALDLVEEPAAAIPVAEPPEAIPMVEPPEECAEPPEANPMAEPPEESAEQPQESAEPPEPQSVTPTEEPPAVEAEPPSVQTIVWRPFPKSDLGEQRG